IAVVGQASSHSPQKMQREKLIRKNSGYQRPSAVSAFCNEMQLTGQATAHRLQATQRSAPSGSRVSTIRPRNRGAVFTGTSGYISVSRLLNACIPIIQILRSWVPAPYTNSFNVMVYSPLIER